MVAAAVIGSAVVGGVASSVSAGKAADAQASAAADSNATQLQIYNQQRTDSTPWREAGAASLSQLSKGLATPTSEFNRMFTGKDMMLDDGYAFRLAEGQKAINRSLAAKGGTLSGAAVKAASRFNQNTASDEYQNAFNRFNSDRTTRFNRLSSIAGVGQTANNQLASAGQNYANNVQLNNGARGDAQAASYASTGRAINSVANSVGQYVSSNMFGGI